MGENLMSMQFLNPDRFLFFFFILVLFPMLILVEGVELLDVMGTNY